MIQELNINGVPTVDSTRSPDLSETLDGTEGVDGLLARIDWMGNALSSHAFYHSDGVGNVTALAVPNGSEIVVAGSYRYDPFGRLIGTPTGLAAINTQRYSSKDWHNASEFYYFGYRFYDPATQGWLNRDPIGEEGGVNLYGYVENDPVNLIDPLGLWGIQFGNFNIGIGNPSYVFDSEVWDQTSDSVHTGLDAIGALEPTPFADGLNGILYGLEGDWGNAGISAAGILPYLGDTAKLGRHGAKCAERGLANLPGKGKTGWKKLKGDQGWKDADGNIWKKDKLHKDHWDVSDKNGNKIREVDYDGNQIWPGGSKNKNK